MRDSSINKVSRIKKIDKIIGPNPLQQSDNDF